MSIHIVRRCKTSTPETEKDNRYWEKRQRNNMAAKKSRENKRYMDSAIRQQVNVLEKENVLLRRELSLIKYKFSIPDGRSLQSLSDNDEYSKSSEDNSDPGLSPVSSSPSEFRPPSFNRTALSKSASRLFTMMYNNGLGDYDTHGQESRDYCHSTTNSDSDGATTDGEMFMYDNCKSNAYRHTESPETAMDLSEHTYTVRDLSRRGRKTSDTSDETGDAREDDGGCTDDPTDAIPAVCGDDPASSRLQSKYKHEEEYESRNVEKPSHKDLKSKLEVLSEQVKSMYDYVYSNK